MVWAGCASARLTQARCGFPVPAPRKLGKRIVKRPPITALMQKTSIFQQVVAERAAPSRFKYAKMLQI
jgi:hypothetical protein